MALVTPSFQLDTLVPAPLVFKKLQSLLKDEDSLLLDFICLAKIDPCLNLELIHFSASNNKKNTQDFTSIEDALVNLDKTSTLPFLQLLAFKTRTKPLLHIFNLWYHSLWEKSIIAGSLLEAFALELELDPHYYYALGLTSFLGPILKNIEKPTTLAKQIAPVTEEMDLLALGCLKKMQFSQKWIDPIETSCDTEHLDEHPAIVYHFALSKKLAKNFEHVDPTKTFIPPETGLNPQKLNNAIYLAHKRLQHIKQFLSVF